MASRRFAWWARTIERRVRALTVAALVVTAALAAGLPRLEFTSAQDTMVPRSSDVYRDNARYQRAFGGEVMIVVFTGDVRALADGRDAAELARLRADLAATGRFHALVGPDSALQSAARQIAVAGPLSIAALARDQAAASSDEERQAITDAFAARTAADGPRLAAVGEQSFDNPRFVDFLLFDEHGAVRPSLRGAFPDDRHALLVGRLEGGMSLAEQGEAVRETEQIVAARDFTGVRTMTTGSAALVEEIESRMRADMSRTAGFAVVAMLVVLLVLMRARWRLLALPVVAVAMVWAFGAFGYLGIPLTMVTISGLPILFGLGVDFAVQLHARHDEEATRGSATPLHASLAAVGPALFVALIAAAVGFLALRISPVPMVRDFAVMLAVGTGVLLVAVLALVPLALVWRDRRLEVRALAARGRRGPEVVVEALASSARRHPVVVAVVALAVVVAGFAVHGRIPVESDPEKFVAESSPVLRDLRTLRDVAGTSADVGLMVEADDVFRPDVLEWMARYEARQLRRHGDDLVSSNSIASITGQVSGSTPTPDDVRTVIDAAPAEIRRTFLADGTRTQILFAVGHLTLDEQEALLESLQRDVDAPDGVRVTASGLAVVGIEAVRGLERGQMTMTIAALAAVVLWLALAFRSLRIAALLLLPVLTAVGASSLAVYQLGVTVSIMGALSNPLVIAVCTEFSVLFYERFREERAAGREPDVAVMLASRSIGRAFMTSGLTIAAGFAVLAFSGFPLLSTFGALVALNVVASMVCALVVVPAVLAPEGRRQRVTRSVPFPV